MMPAADTAGWTAFLYGRASQDRRKKGRSVTAQMIDNRTVCHDYRWPIAAEFRDDDRSASPYAKRRRDDYPEMVQRVAAGEANVIVAWESSRLSRNTEEWFGLRRACQDTGTYICLDGELYDMRNPKHRQRLTREILDAEGEADKIQLRSSRTARQGAAAGAVHGRLLFGYRREYDPDTGDLLRQIPDEATAEYPIEIITRVAARDAIAEIGRSLDARKVLTPGGAEKWNPATVRAIARNPAYIGRRVHQGEITGVAQWPPISDDPDFEATFWTAVGVLADPARRTQRGTAAVHLVSGIAVCGAPPPKLGKDADEFAAVDRVWCGAPLYSNVSDDRSDYYLCKSSGCYGVGVAMDLLDDYVTGGLLTWLEQPGRAEKILKATSKQDTKATLALIAELEAELKEAQRMKRARKLSLASLAATEAGVVPALNAARASLKASFHVPQLGRVVGEDARARWAEMDDVADRRKLIRAVMDIRVLPVGRGRGDARWLPERVVIRWPLGA